MTEWLRLSELDRLLASVDVFERLLPGAAGARKGRFAGAPEGRGGGGRPLRVGAGAARGGHDAVPGVPLVCLVALGAFEGVVRRNPEVGLRLVRVLGERVGVLEERLAELAHGGVTARLAGAILRLIFRVTILEIPG